MYPGFRWHHFLDKRNNLNVCEIIKLNSKGCTYKSSISGVMHTNYWTTPLVRSYIDEGYWIPLPPNSTVLLKALKDAISTNSLS